jgi:hypothetical protein
LVTMVVLAGVLYWSWALFVWWGGSLGGVVGPVAGGEGGPAGVEGLDAALDELSADVLGG